jgi:hypothetical protein
MKKVPPFRRPAEWCRVWLILLLSLPCTAVAQDTVGGTSPVATALRTTPAVPLHFSLSVPPDAPLWDTGITLRAGDSLEISSAPGSCASSGLGGLEELLQSLPVPGAHYGALIGWRGHDDPFVIGEHFVTQIQDSVPLYLGANTNGEAACSGQHQVQVSIRPALAETAIGNDHAALMSHLDRLPRRISDASGRPGDPLNFVLIGPYPAIRAALSAAHWFVADEKKLPAAVHAVLATWAREDYMQMPMSKLYCFGRVQDFGYELAKPLKVAANRHHFRLWLVPWQIDGKDVWIGAATHDIGFTKDHRNGHLTHKIDANVDDEREFILHSLADDVSPLYFTPQDPVRDAHNATGDRFYSDGRVLVMVLKLAPTR